MNTQVEQQENHTVRLTVEVEQPRVDKAMQDAARRIARQVNIPGFRKGKAPYKVVVQRFGEAAVLEEAIEHLGNDVYKEALDETKIEPYAQATLENVEKEPNLKLIFVVPKKPEVVLSNYRDLREEYTPPVVEDKNVDRAIEGLLEQRAVIETAARPAQMGDVLKAAIHATMQVPVKKDEPTSVEVEVAVETAPEGAGEAGAEETAESSAEAPQSADVAPSTPESSPAQAPESAEPPEMVTEQVIDNHDASILVTDDKERDMLPGFSVNMIGVSANEIREFDLAIPEDFDDDDIKGKTLHINVEVKEVQSRTLPVLNDDFAKVATDNKIETLLDLRIDTRKRLQENAEQQARKQYADKIFDKVVAESTVKYPEVMVEDFIDELVKELDDYLRENNLTLNRYKQISDKTDKDIRDMNREKAIARVRSSLVFAELVAKEHIHVHNEDVTARIDELTAQFGDQAAAFRSMFQRPESQNRIA
ncbi:MAG TPA: trigger factor, partial [Aggregatilineales bacterium]|nr:trigger factor [Aggregatilineales bacterium]